MDTSIDLGDSQDLYANAIPDKQAECLALTPIRPGTVVHALTNSMPSIRC